MRHAMDADERTETLALIRSKMDHDLRSNLNVILGYCSILEEEIGALENASGLSDDLACISAAGRELLQLSEQVNDLVQMEEGRWLPAPGNVAVDGLVQDAIDGLSEEYPHAGFRVDGSVSLAIVDEHALKRLIEGMFRQLCGTSRTPMTVEIQIEGGAESASLTVHCSSDELDDAGHQQLRRVISDMTTSVPFLKNIQDFDGYYRTALCKLVGATISADLESYTCRLMVSGGVADTQENPGETTSR